MRKPYTTLAIQLGLVLALAVPAFASAQDSTGAGKAAEPSIADIYTAAEAGKLSSADAMIAQVLAAHPDSAKAHFVHAELLAKEGKLAAAKSEYLKANELAPGLPFAKPQAVAGLLERIDPTSGARTADRGTPKAPAAAPVESSGMGTPAKVGILLLMIAAGVFMFRKLVPGRGATGTGAAPAMPAAPVQPAPGHAYASGPQGYAPAAPAGYGPVAAAAPAHAAGGLGGALMTGAAAGLGALAVGEAVRHFSHQEARTPDNPERRGDASAFGNNLGPDIDADMGGSDFGILDPGSWNDGGTNNNSDW